ncbi:MAG: TIGR01777 family oxidoreductase [Holophagaceae bacterium]
MAADPNLPAVRRVVLAGGNGLLGRRLAEALRGEGTRVQVLSRDPARARVPEGVDVVPWTGLGPLLDGADAVVNLAGEGIADRRWTPVRREAILRSRLYSTRRLVEALDATRKRPSVLVNASATGFYGGRDEVPVDESSPPGTGFLPEVCRAWEAEADRASALGLRVVKVRIGIVLAREGGALVPLARAARCFQGAKLGDGRQGFPWIHLDDLLAVFLRAVKDPALAGAVNAVAPQLLSNEAFTRALCRAVHRPYLALAPGWATALGARVLKGEMASELLLQGAYVRPRRLEAVGFPFRFPTADAALEDLCHA